MMRPRVVDAYGERLERTVFKPLSGTSTGYKLLVLFLLAVVGWGLYAYYTQLRLGLVVTGARDQVMYGLYIVNFVFFIGISYAGALVSAVLRITNAGWRAPITRMAELIAVGGLCDGAIQPIIDLGRPDRVWHIIAYGRFQSPLLWDIVAIMTYLIGSFIYLYLPLIPDFALLRDRMTGNGLKRRFYALFAAGWRNTPEQVHRLEKAIGIMAILIIPLAVSVHTVVAFIFSMTVRPGWNSTVYGIYFVIGAIFSGTAVLVVIIALFRKVYRLHEYITEKHFRYIGYLMLVLLLTYFYLAFSELLTEGYKLEEGSRQLLQLILLGSNAPWFWFFVVGGLVIPAFLLIFSRKHTIPKVVTAAVLVAAGMWMKRYIIVIPTLQVPMMPSFEFGTYTPSWVEISIGAATLAGFSLMFVLASKLLPLISIWEVNQQREAKDKAPAIAEEAVKVA